jgi:hypothetical protein
MAQRAQQIASHLNFPTGLLAGQVAIVSPEAAWNRSPKLLSLPCDPLT